MISPPQAGGITISAETPLAISKGDASALELLREPLSEGIAIPARTGLSGHRGLKNVDLNLTSGPSSDLGSMITPHNQLINIEPYHYQLLLQCRCPVTSTLS
jgi:hypothetical protein